jgi:hypothetical protein
MLFRRIAQAHLSDFVKGLPAASSRMLINIIANGVDLQNNV